jgi:hypothetical protein
MGMYAHSVGDDYSYGLAAHQAWESTRSIFAVLKAALESTRNFYNAWQGTYASIFLMCLQPAVISERLYPLTAVLMLVMIIGSTFFLLHILFTRFLKLERNIRIIVSLSVLFLCIQVLDAPGEAFFWYNGAVHYVFMHSCMLFLIGFMLLIISSERTSARCTFLLISCLLGFVTGGANYVTALLAPILAFSLTGVCFLKKKRKALLLCLPSLCSLCGLILNMTAPGNAIRMAEQTAPMSAFQAVYYSFTYAIEGIGSWTTFYVIFFVLLLLPVLVPALYHSADGGFDFPMPGLVMGFSFCLIAASYTPSLYAMGHVVIFERTLNIMRMLYYLLLILNLIYLTGWITARCRRYISRKSFESLSDSIKQHCVRGFCLCFAAFFLVLLIFSEKNQVTSLSAVHALRKGYAQSYHEETLNRISLLSMEGVDEVWVPNYSVTPYLLDLEDISTDPDNWRNVALADWYGKKTVHLSIIY